MDLTNPEHVGLFNKLMHHASMHMSARLHGHVYYSDVALDVTAICERLPEPGQATRFFWLVHPHGTQLRKEDAEDIDDAMTAWASCYPTSPLFTVSLRRGKQVLFTDIDQVKGWQ